MSKFFRKKLRVPPLVDPRAVEINIFADLTISKRQKSQIRGPENLNYESGNTEGKLTMIIHPARSRSYLDTYELLLFDSEKLQNTNNSQTYFLLVLGLSCKHCSTDCTTQVATGAFIEKTTISTVWRFWVSKE